MNSPLPRTERELRSVMSTMGIPLPPQPEVTLHALMPDLHHPSMLKAHIPNRMRTDPNLPVAVSASISRKLLRTRPRQAPVVFVTSKPDWRRDLMDLVDRYERGQLVFVDPRYCTGPGCVELS